MIFEKTPPSAAFSTSIALPIAVGSRPYEKADGTLEDHIEQYFGSEEAQRSTVCVKIGEII